MIHTLYIGDARELGKVVKPASVDLVATGPPYWSEVTYAGVASDLSRPQSYAKYLEGVREVWQACSRALKRGGVFSFWAHDLYEREANGNHRYIPLHLDLAKALPQDIVLGAVLVWDRYLVRASRTMPRASLFGTRLQYMVVAHKKGRRTQEIRDALTHFYWQPVIYRKTTPELLGSKLLFRLGFGLSRHLQGSFADRIRSFGSMFERDDYRFREYLTECPPDAAEIMIRSFSAAGDVVLDPFVGSGTTMAVCERLRRKCIGVDINPKVVNIVRRKVSGEIVIHRWGLQVKK